MDPAADASQPIKIGLLLAANASLMSLCMIADALRLANREAGQTLYVWQVMSLTTGEAATDAQLQISIQPLEGEDLSQLDQLIIVGSDHYQSEIDLQLAAYLREKAPPSMVIGGVGAGVRVMAHAGLLDGYACAVPLESHFKFRSLYALARSQRSLYCFDGSRYSSLGGAAVLDMILELLWREQGRALAAKVAELLLCDHMRAENELPRQSTWRERLENGSSKSLLEEVIALMEANIEQPLSCSELASLVNMSVRHLQRLFKQVMHSSPHRYYKELRLKRARDLILNSPISMNKVAHVCGFETHSSFCAAYRVQFGISPSATRQPSYTAMPRHAPDYMRGVL